MHIRGIQLVPQLLLKYPDTLYTQYRHIGHLHEDVWCHKNTFWQNDSVLNLAILGHLFTFVSAQIVHLRENQLVPGFYWSHLILCIHNVDTLNICMKKFDAIKIFCWQNDSVLNMHGEINLYQSFDWSYLILCLHNTDTLNICMKKFYAKKLIFD